MGVPENPLARYNCNLDGIRGARQAESPVAGRTAMETEKRRAIIIGGGFGGLAAAKALARANVNLLLMDRRNYHLFQPLLYQVATASLSPADISGPIRTILRSQKNCQVVLAEASAVDVAKRELVVGHGRLRYDYLIIAAGAMHAYFGHDEWASIAPGIKTIEDATELRKRILLAFEAAEYEASPEARRAALTFAIVGGGPTGVELAGAIKEIAGKTLPRDYRHIDTRTTRVILFQGEDRILPQFPPELSDRARRDLERMGVEIRLKAQVTNVTQEGVVVAGQFIPVRNVFWAAGVKADPIGASLGVPMDRNGRILVGPDLTIPGHTEVFVIGDMAAAKSEEKPVPGVAQAAIQMGRYAGKAITDETAGRSSPSERKPFVYHDKGSLAVIGKHKAVAAIGKLRIGGVLAWMLWGGVHIAFLIGFRNRIQVLASWFWSWLLNARDARLITGKVKLEVEIPSDIGFKPDPTPTVEAPRVSKPLNH
jgi:NADH dehydrogenase